MTRLWLAGPVAALSVLTSPVAAQTVETSLRPKARTDSALVTLAKVELVAAAVTSSDQTGPAGLSAWVDGFRDRAIAAGIAPATFDQVRRSIRYEADVIRRDRNQSEFTKTIWEYLDSAASDARIANGRAALDRHADLLTRIEAEYGVDKEVVVAIWGLESAYGTYRGDVHILSALATLAYEGRRGAFFEEQLIAALTILQSGDTTTDAMRGSWAGAMGHTQFIPTSYQTLAVDFDGDGRRDIWSDDPTDALASTAAYLASFGWDKDVPWGVEVTLPDEFDFLLARRDDTRLPSDWAAMGVRAADGSPIPDHGAAAILLPAGAQGAAFMIFDNFGVIERYNTADAYVIGVGHLAARIAGGPEIRADWPREDRALTFTERKEMQERLTARGFDTQGVDGRIGPLTIDAVREFQVAEGVAPDGYASLNVLKRLR